MIFSANDFESNAKRPASAKKAFYSNPDVKPEPIPLNADGIPEELRAAPRWVPWCFVWKGDKQGGGTWTKVPLGVKTGRAADCNNPRSWGTLRQCLNMVAAGKADGVGYAFTDSGHVGLDLDDHRDLVTGRLSEFAQLVLLTFPTYAETSASATGIKLIGKGRFPEGTPKKVGALGIELFDCGYFCLTGTAVPGTPSEVADLQPAIDAHLAELLASGPDREEPAASKKPPAPKSHGEKTRAPWAGSLPSVDEIVARVQSHAKGARLMCGDTSAHGGDHSAADLALCNFIAFYAGNNSDLIDAVFRRSGLMSAKWDEIHARDGRTYAQMTVAKSLAGKHTFFDWSHPPKVAFSSAGVSDSSHTSPPDTEPP